MNTAGIDVAHKTLALAVSTEEKLGKVREFANTPSGHAALIKRLARCAGGAGVPGGDRQLSPDLALAIDAAGLALMVLNPKAAKRFAEALQTRNKSDAVDAGVLAQFARRMPFEPWRRPATEALELRACARRLEALVVDRTRAKNQLHALLQSTTTPAVVLDDVRLSIHQYTAQIDALRDWADARISADEELAQVYRLLTGIPGIAAASAIQLMGELLVLPEDMRAKQWVALAGLDPRQSTSGTSVNKPPRLSKAGNAHLRKALFMPALSAARHEPHVNSYYTHLIEARGLKKIQAICAVMRKLLHAIHAMLKHRQAFDGSRFCLLREAAA
ncbi:MAG: IS110 family transposase [Thiocapsa sp.]|uniref:IS110 family transposase n=1 Tax=Thiocapsa sp. TaxID=2024551 RepID=UPI001BD10F48|nr:IS110 family transposase [Thiocapsa sp.]QVL48972.1 MAG: IS110 family transposase [Thiocapsa sp.]